MSDVYQFIAYDDDEGICDICEVETDDAFTKKGTLKKRLSNIIKKT